MIAFHVRQAFVSDAETFAARLRKESREEIAATFKDVSVKDAIEHCLRASAETGHLTIDDSPAALWGIVPRAALTRVAEAWLITTPVVEAHPKTFWLATHQILPDILNRWPMLTSAVDMRRKDALQWGARIGMRYDRQPILINGHLFKAFTLTRVRRPTWRSRSE